MKHVTGIGGFFFRSDDHKALAAWYNKHFGINDQENGWIWQQDAGPTVFSPFKRDSDYFDSKQQLVEEAGGRRRAHRPEAAG